MKITYPHSFSADEALGRVRALTDYWSKKYGVSISWNKHSADVRGKVRGMSFSGVIQIEDALLAANFKVGMLAEKLGGRAYVERKLGEYLDPDQTLDTLRARAS